MERRSARKAVAGSASGEGSQQRAETVANIPVPWAPWPKSAHTTQLKSPDKNFWKGTLQAVGSQHIIFGTLNCHSIYLDLKTSLKQVIPWD